MQEQSRQKQHDKDLPEGPVEYKVFKDRYVGQIDPETKLRQGRGVYTYSNAYFQYHGEWQNGVKHGKGVLLMRDGSKYEGDFEQGEMSGQGILEREKVFKY